MFDSDDFVFAGLICLLFSIIAFYAGVGSATEQMKKEAIKNETMAIGMSLKASKILAWTSSTP